MALTVQHGEGYGYQIAALFGVGKELIAKAMSCKIDIAPMKGTLSELVVVHGKGLHEHPVGCVVVKGTALTLAKAGKMGPASKQAIAGQFIGLLEKGIKYHEGLGFTLTNCFVQEVYSNHVTNGLPADGVIEVIGGDIDSSNLTAEQAKIVEGAADTVGIAFTEKQVAEAMKQLGVLPTKVDPGVSTAKDKSMSDGIKNPKIEFPEAAKVKFNNKVKLGDALVLGQPVSGTSHASTYYVVAMFNGLNMAVMSNKAKLSIRVAGSSINQYVSSLKALGFTIHDDYASAHFNVKNKDLSYKTLGAVIGGIGFQYLKSPVDLTGMPL